MLGFKEALANRGLLARSGLQGSSLVGTQPRPCAYALPVDVFRTRHGSCSGGRLAHGGRPVAPVALYRERAGPCVQVSALQSPYALDYRAKPPFLQGMYILTFERIGFE